MSGDDKKKILIMTHHLGRNYGGMAQGFAMQYVLESMGFASESTYAYDKKAHLKPLKRMVKQVLHIIKPEFSDVESSDIDRYSTEKTKAFVDKNINIVAPEVTKNPDLISHYYALISGSDQVFRNNAMKVEMFLFDFAETMSMKKVSYAASFGSDDPTEYPGVLRKKTRRLAQKFDAISVREDSGVTLAKELWNVEAIEHVDPTFLVGRDIYEELAGSEELSNIGVFAYVLDDSKDKKDIADKISNVRGVDVKWFMPPKPLSRKELAQNPSKYELPKVEKWFSGFRDANFIVTDSFHGTVFSIIFNKPFAAIGNKKRGMARFTSLLSKFGLEDRLVTSADEVTEELINKPIDWDTVNAKIKAEQKRSFDYLKKHLG